MGAQSSTQSAAPGTGGAGGDMPRILIVDDDVDAADSLASLLQSTGYGDARVAYTGATALALAVEFVPTVLLVDLDLPDMSGYERRPSSVSTSAATEPETDCLDG